MAISPSKLPTQAYRTAWIASMWACLALSGCDDKPSAPSPAPPQVVASAASRSPAMSPPPVSADNRPRARASNPASSIAPPSSSTNLPPAVHDLGVSAPAVLANDVMVVKTKGDDLVLSALREGRFEPITTDVGELSAWPVHLASGSSTHAYWVSKGRLVRREIKPGPEQGPIEVVASDAANAAVAAARSSGPVDRDVVLYIGAGISSEGERAARLWVEGHGSRPISRDAGGATSVAITPLGGGRFALLTLDGRVGMSPVHAISLELDAEGAPHLGEDKVVHVAGPAQRRTALTGVLLGRGPMVLLPISKDATSFGLLMLRVGYGDGDAPSSWVDYPNGLDPAPVATTTACGKPTVAFVRPQTPKPDSARVLELARLDASGALVAREEAALSKRINHVDLWGDRNGGWLVYATDEGLRGRRIECE